MPSNITSVPDEPASDTCQNESENDTRQNETDEDKEFEDVPSERDSPDLPGPEDLLEDISLLGNNNNLEEPANDEEHALIDDGQIVFALDDEAVVSPSPSRSVVQSSELTADVAFDEDEFDLGF